MPLDHFMADFILQLHVASVQNENSTEKKEVAVTKVATEDNDSSNQKKDDEVIY